MELNERERKLVERLRRQQENWRFACITLFFINVILLSKGMQGVLQQNLDRWSLFLVFASLYGFWYVAAKWHGRPETLLLLKCLDAPSSEAEQRAAGDVRNARA